MHSRALGVWSERYSDVLTEILLRKLLTRLQLIILPPSSLALKDEAL
jgi:hypothetical protein